MEFRKRRSQAGTRYRESGLVRGSLAAARRNFLGVRIVPKAEVNNPNMTVKSAKIAINCVARLLQIFMFPYY